MKRALAPWMALGALLSTAVQACVGCEASCATDPLPWTPGAWPAEVHLEDDPEPFPATLTMGDDTVTVTVEWTDAEGREIVVSYAVVE